MEISELDVRHGPYKADRTSRTSGRNSRVFVNTPESSTSVEQLADDWFSKCKIWMLDYKCKTWASVVRKSNSVLYSTLREKFDATKVRYSRNAGCSCGCSPGFIVEEAKHEGRRFTYAHCDITSSEEEANSFKEFLVKATVKLRAEMAEHGQTLELDSEKVA